MPIGKRANIRGRLRRGHANNPHKLASCEGKERLTAAEARERASKIPGLVAYKCKYCPHYHNGRRPWK